MIKAEIVADSLSPQGDRLISVLATFPRIILAEVNTHRMLTKNTSSSRAIPLKKMVQAVIDNPFIPVAWQKDHKGMQGYEYFTEEDGYALESINEAWIEARDRAVQSATRLHKAGVTKQLCNRLLEPFMWTTMLITGSEEGWNNFFSLRNPSYDLSQFGIRENFISKKIAKRFLTVEDTEIVNKWSDLDWLEVNRGQAEIHMMALAEYVYDAMNESTPRQLEVGEWHIPFEDKINITDKFAWDNSEGDLVEAKVKISTSLGARTSYTVIGEEKEISYKRMIDLHDELISQDPPHSSPMEHCARAMTSEEYYLFNRGEAYIDGWHKSPDVLSFTPENRGWCRNFKGFIPYRHIIETQNE